MLTETKIVNNNLIEIQHGLEVLLPTLVHLGHTVIILGLKFLQPTVDNVFVPRLVGVEILASFPYKGFLFYIPSLVNVK